MNSLATHVRSLRRTSSLSLLLAATWAGAACSSSDDQHSVELSAEHETLNGVDISPSSTSSLLAAELGAADLTPPTIGIHTPLGTNELPTGSEEGIARETVLRGAVVFRFQVTDNRPLGGGRATFTLDQNAPIEVAKPVAPERVNATTVSYRLPWNSRLVGNGVHSMKMQAWDAAGNPSRVVRVSFRVHNPSAVNPHGFVRGLAYSHAWSGEPPTTEVLQNMPFVRGLATVVRWSQLQPNWNSPLDFRRIDATAAVDPGNGREKLPYVLILKSGGNGLPAWVGHPTEPATPGLRRPVVPPKAAGGASDDEPSAVPWDQAMLDYWQNVNSQIAARYDDDARFAGVYLSGSTARYPEMVFPATQPPFSRTDLPPPNGIAAATDEQPRAYDAATYASAWINVLKTMTSQYRNTRIVTMLDAMNTAEPYEVFDRVWSAIVGSPDGTSYVGRVAAGTANLGNTVDLSAKKYQTLRGGSGMPPIYYEIGPNKVSDALSTHALYDAITRCGKGQQNCNAALVFGTSLRFPGDADRTSDRMKQAACAACVVWGHCTPAPQGCSSYEATTSLVTEPSIGAENDATNSGEEE